MGPLLFLIYINDVINCTSCENCTDSKECVNFNACTKLGHFVPFADDANIFVSGKEMKKKLA